MQVSEQMTSEAPPWRPACGWWSWSGNAKRVTSAVVVQDGLLVVVVSRSDIVRQLVVARTRAEYVSDIQRSDIGTDIPCRTSKWSNGSATRWLSPWSHARA